MTRRLRWVSTMLAISLMLLFMFTGGTLAASVTVPLSDDVITDTDTMQEVAAVEREIAELLGKRSVSFYYECIGTGDVYTHNVSKTYDVVSTAKTPVVLCVYNMAAEGQLNLDDTMAYRSEHYQSGTGVIQGSKTGAKFTIRTLARYAIHHSDNIAFRMLKEKIGSNLYTYVKSIDAKYTLQFTVTDIAAHLRALYNFSEEGGELGQELLSYFIDTAFEDRIPSALPDTTVAHKVGMRGGIYHDTALVLDDMPYILVIMTANGDGTQSFFKSLTTLIYKRHKLLHNITLEAL